MKIQNRWMVLLLVMLLIVSVLPMSLYAAETTYDTAFSDFGEWLSQNASFSGKDGGYLSFKEDNLSLEIAFTKSAQGDVTDIQFNCIGYWKDVDRLYTYLTLFKGKDTCTVHTALLFPNVTETKTISIGELSLSNPLFSETIESASDEFNETYLAYAREQIIKSVAAAEQYIKAAGHILADFGFNFAADSLDNSVQTGLENFKAINQYSEGQFTDVKSSDWYSKYVEWAYNFALMGGTRSDYFNANGNVTIAETITMAAGMNSIYHTGTKSFELTTPWYQTYVDYAVGHDIIKENQFTDYNKPATRTEFVTVMSSAFPKEAFPAINNITKIPDVPKTMASADRIYTFYNAGIIAGSDKYGTFNPDSNIKRSEVAVIVRNMVLKDSRGKTVLEVKTPSNIYFGTVSWTLNVGQEFICAATVADDYPHKEITYSSNNPAVVKVVYNTIMRCVSPGTAIITATAADGMTATCTVTVKGTEPTTPVVTPTTPTDTPTNDLDYTVCAKDTLRRLRIIDTCDTINRLGFDILPNGGIEILIDYTNSHDERQLCLCSYKPDGTYSSIRTLNTTLIRYEIVNPDITIKYLDVGILTD